MAVLSSSLSGRSFSLRKKLSDLPIPRKLSLIIGLFSTVIVALLLLSYFGMEILSGSRAYVGGEGLWSKAQKAAVFYLTRYAYTRTEAYYQKYLYYIAVPLGDHEARLELEKPKYDFAVVSDGFLKGRNNPADFRIMVFMVRWFNTNSYIKRAIIAWGRADATIEELQTVAAELHKEIQSRRTQPAHIRAVLEQIQDISNRLTPLEDEFSYALGDGARWLKGVLFLVMVLATALFLGLASWAASLISRHLCEEIDNLRENAKRVAAGDYRVALHVDSQDEIGDLARTFQDMALQREEAERLKDEFFANVSHELRTPLTLILSPLESILAGDCGALEPPSVNLLKTMHNNTVRLLQLVNGLLDFAKLNAGRLKVERESIRVADLTETLYKDFQPMIHLKNIKGELEVEPRDALVMMDRYLYERILFNLLSNAVKFTPPGGRLKVSMQWAADRLTLAVSDSGIGIPDHELQNIFRRFRQVEGSSTRRFEGTGLGLSLVKEFAGLLEGSVEVKSQTGQGSTFTVNCAAPSSKTSPVNAKMEEGAARMKVQRYDLPSIASFESATQGSLPKVLIAEDNTEMAVYMGQLLQSFCQIRVVGDGNQALEEVQSWSPDLILTDVMMPRRDGLSLCREIKANPVTAKIPIVMLTALTHREALLEGWKAGANEYLFKPFHPKELVTRVQSLLKAVQDQKQALEKIVHLNESLRNRAFDLATTNQELEAFSYSVSHDLRTPLRAIEGFTNELLTGPGPSLDPQSQKDLQRIRAAVKQMEQLIEDLLKLSQLSRSTMKMETVDLSAQVHSIAERIKEVHPERSVNYAIAPGVTVQGDAHLLQIALENLVQNAWKFTKKQPQPKIEFGVSYQNGKKTFFVRDNGAGFDMAYVGELFKPFHRLHNPSDFPGTGLGLALVERIVQRHGGHVWAVGEENKGATFYIELS